MGANQMEDIVPLNLDQAHERLDRLLKEYGLDLNAPKLEAPISSASLDSLVQFALDSRTIELVLSAYQPLFLLIVAKWVTESTKERQILHLLARIVSVYPQCVPLVELFLSHNLRHQHIFTVSAQDSNLLLTLLAMYRLLKFDHDRFSPFIDPKTVFSLLEDTTVSSATRYLAVRVLALHFKISEAKREQWIYKYVGDNSEPIDASFEQFNSIDLRFLPLAEAKRISQATELVARYASEPVPVDQGLASSSLPECPLLVNIGGVLLPRIGQISPLPTINSKFVSIPTSKKALTNLADALLSSKPVLLNGLAGSGKTYYVDELAKRFGAHESLVRIHLGDQTDAKILIGTYTTGKKPGSFEWHPGILTVAVKEGRWVLIEDIDKAPTEILSVLLPLLEKRELMIPSRGETVKAARGFRIFGTVRTSAKSSTEAGEGDATAHTIPHLVGQHLWSHVHLPVPSKEELRLIIDKRLPLLRNISQKFVSAFEQVEAAMHQSRFASLSKSQARPVSTRDLIKWATRSHKNLQHQGVTSPDTPLSSETYDYIFAEAMDCFTGSIALLPAKAYISEILGGALDISSARIELYLRKHIPTLSDNSTQLHVGRTTLQKSAMVKRNKRQNFALTNHSKRLLEQLGQAVSNAEPLLLVGETGTGKTTVVQYLANCVNKKLVVINVSQQTESGDLLGSYKPVDAMMIAAPLREEFDELFEATFSSKKNEKFSTLLNKWFKKKSWNKVVESWKAAIKTAKESLNADTVDDSGPKKKRRLDASLKEGLVRRWEKFHDNVSAFETQIKMDSGSIYFSFVEGSLVRAIRNGDWVLLDEVNLASPDTLESIAELLGESPSITLSEKGDAEAIRAHPDFRLFACMNPATDVGKRDLPPALRTRFTELYVASPDQDIEDLLMIVHKYIGSVAMSDEWVVHDVAELYLEAKRLSEENKVVDGANQKPHFSIRTLSRTLVYAALITPIYGLRRSLYEGFCMSFLTLLDQKSEAILEPLISKHILGRLRNAKSIMSQIPAMPKADNGAEYVQFKHYWLQKGPEEPLEQPEYIITPFVEKNLLNLARATAGRSFPILIQGPTSSGKTSMIKYLAMRSGHKFVRINNHEHTDLQEYLGTYVSDDTGQLKFREGILVEALRNGYWIVLDELNLAPTDVLEALNRLLDDNRELLIPDTQEIVRPHPEFMLFATQNPPGLYGGRKVLSRAFRNRFLELHFDDIPQDELEIILHQRCRIAPSYAKRIVDVYRELSVMRQSTRVFEQKNSFATLRDLFRWAGRDADNKEQLALHGYMLLAERARTSDDKLIVKNAIEKVMRVPLNPDKEYDALMDHSIVERLNSVVWTNGMRRLFVLVSEAVKNNEPVLLVGETGCGKTTVCQILADIQSKQLHIVNAHQNTETGDIIGAQRPVRNRSEAQDALRYKLRFALEQGGVKANEDVSLDELKSAYASLDKTSLDQDLVVELSQLLDREKALFEWSDGSLVVALKAGDPFLLDEISLADDSVLERLNSVLEPERTIFLSEKGTSQEDSTVTAKDGFQFFATMNPGGDYGKKELSPALRNRFTEIWVPSMDDFDDVMMIVKSRLEAPLHRFAKPIVEFSEWFGVTFDNGSSTSGLVSLRDILAWTSFVNQTSHLISPELSVFHGACMVFIDSVGSTHSASMAQSPEILKRNRLNCVEKMSELVGVNFAPEYQKVFDVSVSPQSLAIGPFSIPRDKSSTSLGGFSLNAPTTALNALRVLRGMQLRKPVLLEGSPGVGKTSLITAIAEATGQKLTRINLSEQTDLIDLFGADAPAGNSAGEFAWKDAPFLRAMQQGEWVLLDEMNLASQSVLEGLNACLDHRGEAYIPELDKTFKSHPNFTVFAAQNPQIQGGGRKGLPKSFLNRFTVVYVDTLTLADLQTIAKHLYRSVDADIVDRLLQYVLDLDYSVNVTRKLGMVGGPFEFNLRDVMRWLSLMCKEEDTTVINPYEFFEVVIQGRFRTVECRKTAKGLFETYFGPMPDRELFFNDTAEFIQAGRSVLHKKDQGRFEVSSSLLPLQCNTGALETAITCVQNSWPLILVGPANSGKSSVIKYLAGVSGVKLHEFSMNGDVDSTDLLGGYEQVDIAHKSFQVWNEAELLAQDLISLIVDDKRYPKSYLSFPLRILSSQESHEDVKALQDILTEMPRFDDESNSRLQSLYDQVVAISNEASSQQTVRFQWFDGILLQAVSEGHWLVLDNANLCNASVLDRLNSLLEPNGSLIVNECSLENGEPRVVVPHKNFRLFLTVDPKFGELSRAMRNRGIELYLDDLQDRATPFDKELLGLETVSEPQLEKLSVKDSTMAPVSKHIGINESAMTYFAAIVNGSQRYEDSHSFAAMAINFMSLSDVQLVSKWRLLEAANSRTSSVAEQIESWVGSLEHSPYAGLLTQSYSGADAKYGKLSPIASPYMRRQMKFTSEEMFALLLVCQLGESVGSLLKEVKHKAEVQNPSQMTYLVKSAALANGRILKHPVRVPVYSVAEAIVAFAGSVTLVFDQTDKMPLFYGIYKGLQVARDVATMTDGSAVDESQLHVYRSILESWMQSQPWGALQEPLLQLQQVIGQFSDQLELSSGTSMARIWSRYSLSQPKTAHGWKLYHRMQKVASEFDFVSSQLYSDSKTSIAELRHAILHVMRDLCIVKEPIGFEGIIETLENKIELLQQQLKEFVDKRTHIFQEAFTRLFLNVEISDYVDNRHFNTLVELCQLSNVPTQHLTEYTKSHDLYMPALATIWGFDDDALGSHIVGPSRDELFSSILDACSQFGAVPANDYMQAFEDFKQFSTYWVQNMGQVVRPKKPVFGAMLSSLLSKVVDLHEGSEGKEKAIFESVSHGWLTPASQALQSGDLGIAWVLFSAGMIRLYVPDLPYDPAIKQHVDQLLYDSHMRSHNLNVQAIQLLRHVLYGGEESAILSAYKRIISLEEAPKEETTVHRPSPSQIGNLSQELNSIVSSSIGEASVRELLQSDPERIQNWQISVLQFVKRVSMQYPYYADLTKLLEGFIFGLKLGFAMHTDALLHSSALYWMNDPFIISDLSKLESEISSLNLKQHGPNIVLHALDLILLNAQTHGYDKCAHVADQVFSGVHVKWYAEQLKLEEEQRAKEAVYDIEDAEKDLAQDFNRIFPDYEGDFEEFSASTNKRGSEDVYYGVASRYLRLFNKDNATSESLKSVIVRGSKVLESVTVDQLDQFSDNNVHTAGSTILLLASVFDDVQRGGDESSFNFYHDSKLRETMRVVEVIRSVKFHTLELLKRWPEHAVLQNISMSCQELLQYSVQTPVARFLQKVEQIFMLITDWERYASKEVSMSLHISKLSGLIISWRKLELSTWSNLFEFELRQLEQGDLAKWWFHLYESIIIKAVDADTSMDSDYIVELVRTITVFLTSSSRGQFRSRLDMLNAFKNDVALRSKGNSTGSAIAGALNNIISFYELYAPMISETIAKETKALKKEIEEVILLASWKDTNADALKESARKSHHKLHKIIRKYREVISEKVTPLFDAAPAVSEPSEFAEQAPIGKEPTCNRPSSLVESIQVYLDRRDILKRWRTVELLHSKSFDLQQSEMPLLKPFVTETLEDAEQLRKETPSVLNDETKKIVSSLRAEKGKLLSETIKSLRLSGLATTVKKSVAESQKSVSDILARAPSNPTHYKECGDSYFYRLLEMFPRLQASVIGSESDVPHSDLQRAFAISQNLLDALTRHRKSTVGLVEGFNTVRMAESELQEVTALVSSDDYLIQSSRDLECWRWTLLWLPQVLQFAGDIVDSCSTFDDKAPKRSQFDMLQSRAQDMYARFQTLYGDSTLATNQKEIACQSILKDLQVMKEDLVRFTTSSSNYAYPAEMVISWIDDKLSDLSQSTDLNSANDDTLELLEKDITGLCNSILVIAQEVSKLGQDFSEPGNDGWFKDTHKRLEKMAAVLRQSKIVSLIRSMLNRMLSLGCKDAVTLVSTAMPFVHEYSKLCKVVQFKAQTYCRDLSKSSYMLSSMLYNLATNGFCTPQEESNEEPQDSGQTKEGTGLGDGSGAQDSKDPGDEEDLNEHAQTANDEADDDDKEKEDGEEDNAVDIEGDMEGQLEDAPDQEGDDEGENEEENELDEEVGDIDDLDPNAVDEKMWDEESSKEKEKQSDKVEGTSADDAQGIDDQNDNQQDDKDNDAENDNENDQVDEKVDDDENADEEEDVGEQEDDVQQQSKEDLEEQAQQGDALELPENMDIDDDENDDNAKDDMNEDVEDMDEMDDMNDMNDMNDDMNEDVKDEENDDTENMDTMDQQDGENDEEDADMADQDGEEDQAETEQNGEVDEEPQAEQDADQMDEDQHDQDPENKDQDTAERTETTNLEMEDSAIQQEAGNDDQQQDSGTKGTETSEVQGEGSQDVPDAEDTSFGGANANVTKDQKEKEEPMEDKSRQQANESLKNLGDALKEFYKRRQEIQESSTQDDTAQDTSNTRPDEFEHVEEGQSSERDTQALGSADQDQAQRIDDQMAIEEDDEEENVLPDDATATKQEPTEDHGEGDGDAMDEDGTGNVKETEEEEKDDDYKDRIKMERFDDTMESIEVPESTVDAKSEFSTVQSLSTQEAMALWKKHESAVHDLSLSLCEQLRLILEPTKATKMRGDYKTGKRLNMRRIIPYIASQFKKDKIWMRRTKPSKREYKIMIALDDSKSMAESQETVDLAFQTISLVSKALTQLEAGQLAVTRFGEDTDVVHPFERPFTSQSGPEVLRWFGFDQTRTDMRKLVEKSLRAFEDASLGSSSEWQLEIIISDGVCEDHDTLRRLIRRAREEKIMMVFIVVDGINQQGSITDMNQANYEFDANGVPKLKMTRYLDTFPFDYYVIVRDIYELPHVLSLVLRQYFSEMAE
uniref:Midasin n=1 Tax=Blastobotrys adeninivorans TaxID=409370 RepID=A0A060T1F5_BLAAD